MAQRVALLLAFLTACAAGPVERKHLADGSWHLTCRLPMDECVKRFEAVCMDKRYRILSAQSKREVRDVNPVVQIGLQLWLYLTPVAYSLSQVSGKYRWLFVLNPLSAIVEGFRSVLVFGRAPDWTLTAISAAMTLALFLCAFLMFKRMDKYFADVI